MDISGIIIGLIAGMFSALTLMSQKQGTYVTADRKEWRDFIRQWQVNTQRILSNSSIYTNPKIELDLQKTAICSRLNPIEDVELIDKIRSIQLGTNTIFNEVVDELNLLLKFEWERVKVETTFLGSGILNIIFLLYFPYIVFMNYDYFIHEKFESAFIFYGILFGIFALSKAFYYEMRKFVSVRILTKAKLRILPKKIELNINFISLISIVLFFIGIFMLNRLYPFLVLVPNGWVFALLFVILMLICLSNIIVKCI